jgi:hypothetical protein
MYREETKQFYRYLGMKPAKIKDNPHMEEVELYCNLLCENSTTQ